MPVDDGEYNNTSYSSSAVDAETTPSQRILEANMMAGAKSRVDKVTVKRCLIENKTEFSGLDYVHCLKRSTGGRLARIILESHQLDRLEFAWNMEPSTLNVDTRYNIIRLSPSFHKTFNANEWLLLPETRIIDAYYDGIDTHKFPIFEDEVYEYTLLAHQSMQKIPIRRQNSTLPSDLPTPTEPPAENFTYYHYPYHDFPTIKSHVHPRFVICDSGPKLYGHWFEWKKEHEAREYDIGKVSDIWYSWTKDRAAPTGGSTKTTSDGGNPDIKVNSSQKTTSHRVRRNMRLTRKAAGEQGSLDYETLDQRTSSRNGRGFQKNAWIQDWLLDSKSAWSSHEDTVVIGGGEVQESLLLPCTNVHTRPEWRADSRV
ncbi:hypothetical protein EDB83DRAFT_2311708 [Lactarius deliciosus]|nr:hypothetical protein EDB83DRAFT_2311708 [Lactarius deliciosus]